MFVACAAEVTPSADIDDDTDETTRPTPTAPKYTDEDPAPLYDDEPVIAPDLTPVAPTPVKPAPVEPVTPEPAPVDPTPAPVDPTPAPVPVEPTPVPAPVALTACKLPSGIVLTCDNRAIYQRDLFWLDASLVGYTCTPDAVQCKPGAACSAVRSDGTTETGKCK